MMPRGRSTATATIGFACILLASTSVNAGKRAPTNERAAAIHRANVVIGAFRHSRTARVDSNTRAPVWLGYQPEGGGTLYGYFIGDSLCRLEAEVYTAVGMMRTEVYFIRGAVVFIYLREDYYPPTDTGVDVSRLTFGHEARYYVNDGALVESQKRGKDKFGARQSPAEELHALLPQCERWRHSLIRQ